MITGAEAGIVADVLAISVGALVGTGVNLEAKTKGVNGSVSESSCFISADGLRPEKAEI